MKRRDFKRSPVHFYVVHMVACNLKIARLSEISNSFISQTGQKAVFYRSKEELYFKATTHLLPTTREDSVFRSICLSTGLPLKGGSASEGGSLFLKGGSSSEGGCWL